MDYYLQIEGADIQFIILCAQVLLQLMRSAMVQRNDRGVGGNGGVVVDLATSNNAEQTMHSTWETARPTMAKQNEMESEGEKIVIVMKRVVGMLELVNWSEFIARTTNGRLSAAATRSHTEHHIALHTCDGSDKSDWFMHVCSQIVAETEMVPTVTFDFISRIDKESVRSHPLL